MIIFYYGADGYRLSQAVTKLTQQYREKYRQGLSAFLLSADDSDGLESLENALKLNSLFNETSLIVVRGIFHTTATSDRLSKMLREHAAHERKDIVVVLIGDGDFAKTKHKALLRLLINDEIKTKEFKPLTGSGLIKWIIEACSERGAAIEPQAVARLVELVGEEPWAIIQEIEKLSNYSNKIGEKEVTALVFDGRNIGPFELVDAVGLRNSARALALLEQEISHGRDPYNILGALTSHFRALLFVHDGSAQGMTPTMLANESGLHPFVVRKAFSATRLFTITETREMFVRLADLDRLTKDGCKILTDELFTFLIRMQNIAN